MMKKFTHGFLAFLFVAVSTAAFAQQLSTANSQQLYAANTGMKPNAPGKTNAYSDVTPDIRQAVNNTLRQSTNYIWFESNVGQFNNTDVKYGFRTPFGSMGVYNNKIRIVTNQKEYDEDEDEAAEAKEGHHMPLQIVDLTFPGSNNTWTIEPGSVSSVHGSYYKGTDKNEKAQTPTIYNEITLKNVYPGIDLRLYSGAQGSMEFDWIVAKASDYSKIKMQMTGQDGLLINKEGNLTIKMHENNMTLVTPETFQTVGGSKKLYKTSMVKVSDNVLGYSIASGFDPNQPLVIDPVMMWSTYMHNGSSSFDEYLYSIASNPAGEVYCAGFTNEAISVAYLNNVAPGYSSTFGANPATILYKLNANGTTILAWTYTGVTGATNWPSDLDIFPDGRILLVYTEDVVQIFTATLAARSYSGSINTAVPASGNHGVYQSACVYDNSTFYVSGSATSNFPNTIIPANAPDPTFAGTTEGFIIRVIGANTATLTADWGTYVGGNGNESFASIALSIDKTKLAFAVYSTVGAAYPTLVNAVDNTAAGASEILIGSLNASATPQTAFTMFSYLGGSGADGAAAVTLGANTIDCDKAVVCADNNYFYVGYNTSSIDIPGTTGAVQTANGGGIDQVLARVPWNGSAGTGFVETYMGGSSTDIIGGIAVDFRSSNVLLFGSTSSTNYPTNNTTPSSPYYQSAFGGIIDICYASFSNNLATRTYGTYLGGTEKDYLGSTGTLRGSGHLYYNNTLGLVYIGTTIHSDSTTMPRQWIADVPGFDKGTPPQTAGKDNHFIFEWNSNTFDYGDAPVSYEGGNAARSALTDKIRIGAAIDAETGSLNSATANGDDISNTGVADDEDGISVIPILTVGATTYSVNVSVFNNTGASITLRGWVDANNNGTFDATESAFVTVPTSGSQQTVTLPFTTLPAVVYGSGNTFIRIRLSDGTLTATNAQGEVQAGEVEDYQICIKPNAGADQTVCLIGTANMSATGAGTWTAQAGNPGTATITSPTSPTTTITNFSAVGTYRFIFTNGTGCTDTANVIVTTQPGAVTITPSAPVNICAGQSVTLTASSSPAGGTFQWSPLTSMNPANGVGASVIVTPASTTTYTVVYSIGGCTSTNSRLITVYSGVVAEAGVNQTYCSNVSTTITLGGSPTASGGSGNYAYAWTPPTNLSNPAVANPTVSPIVSGTTKYFVTVTDNVTGCTSVDSMILTINPAVTVSIALSDTDLCLGQSTTLTATGLPSGGTYSWAPIVNMTPPAGNVASVSVAPSGTQTYTVTYSLAGCTNAASRKINVYPNVTASAGADQTYCLPHPATITIGGSPTANGGSGTFSYAWSPSTNLSSTTVANPTITSVVAGTTTYTVTVTDTKSGCQATASMVLTINSQATVSITSPDTNLCAGQSATLTASGLPAGGTYQWSPLTNITPAAGNTAVVVVSPPVGSQSYIVTYTTAGCSGTATKTVNVVSNVLAHSGGNQTYCMPYASTITLGGAPTGTGGSGNYSYLWSPSTRLSSTTVANPTLTSNVASTIKYFVTVTDNVSGCTSTDSVILTLNPAVIANAGTTQSVCSGSGTLIGASPAGTGGTGTLTYAWSPGTGLSATNIANPTASPLSNTTYTLTVTDTKGCSAVSSVLVTVNSLPTADAGPTQILTACSAASVTIGGSPTGSGAAPLTYGWSPAGGLSATNVPNPTVSNIGSNTTYTVTVTDAKGCQATASVKVNVTSSTLQVDAGVGGSYCEGTGGSVTLNGTATGGTAPYTYGWTPISNLSAPTALTTVANPSAPGSYLYTLNVRDNNGCNASDTVRIDVWPAVIADAGPAVAICSGFSDTIGGNPTASVGTSPYVYAWSPGSGLNSTAIANPIANPLGNTTYVVTVTDGHNCQATSSVLVTVNANPLAHAGTDQSYCLPVTSVIKLGAIPAATGGSGTYTYSWSPSGSLSSATAANPTYTVSGATSTEFRLTVTDAATLCTGVDSTHLTILAHPTVTIASLDTDLCTGQSATLTATGLPSGGGYQWQPLVNITPGAGNTAAVVVNPTATQTYQVIYTQNLCTDTAYKTVRVYPAVVANAAPNQTFCLPVTSTITIGGNPSASGGSGSYSYTWSPATNLSSTTVANPTITTVVAGTTTYFLTVTDNITGCQSTSSMVLTINPVATVSIPLTDTNLCSGQSTTLIAVGSPGGGTYQWSPTFNMNPGLGNTASVIVAPSGTQTYQVTYTANGCSGSAAVTVNVYSPVVAHGGINQSFCLPYAGTIFLGPSSTATGGSGSYSYHWSPGAALSDSTSPNPSVAKVNSSIEYYVTVTDNITGCTAVDSTHLTIDSHATLTINSLDTDLCFGQTTVLNGVANPLGGTYQWVPVVYLNPGTGNTPSVTVQPITTQVYQLVYSRNGCQDTAYKTVNVYPQVVAHSGGNQSYCLPHSDPVTLGAASTATGGSGSYSYHWSPGAVLSDSTIANPVITSMVAGTTTYYLTVTDAISGCTSTDSMILILSPQVSVSITSPRTDICLSDAAVLTANGMPGGGNYQWAPLIAMSPANGNAQVVSVSPASGIQTYFVYYNLGGCTDTASVVVHTYTQPVANAGGNQSFCLPVTGIVRVGQPATGGSGIYSYHWSPAVNVSDSTIARPRVDSLTTPGSVTYTVTVTDLVTGCTSIDSMILTLNARPGLAITSPDTNLCAGQSTTLTASPLTPSNGTYQWQPLGNLTPGAGNTATVTFTPTGVGPYNFQVIFRPFNTIVNSDGDTVIVATGCADTAYQTIHVYSTVTAQAGADRAFCSDTTSIQIGQPATGGSGSFTYAWSSNPAGFTSTAAQPTVTFATFGTVVYTVTVTDAISGCTGVDSVVITRRAPPAVDAGQDKGICIGSSTQLVATGALTYVWAADPTLNNPNFCCPTATPTATTTYTVTGTDVYGCSASDTVQVSIKSSLTVTVAPVTVCQGDTVTFIPNLIGANYRYLWDPGTGLTCTSCATPQFTLTSASTSVYHVTITDTITGCSGTDTFSVTIHGTPTAAFTYITACVGDTVHFTDHSTVQSVNDTIISWSYNFGDLATFADTSHAPSPGYVYTTAAPGHDAVLLVTTNFGCSDSVHANVSTFPPVVANAGADTAIGYGSSVVLSATGGVTFAWSPKTGLSDTSSASPVATPLVSTTYYVTVTSSNGCTGVDSVRITVIPLPNVSAGPDLSTCLGSPVRVLGSSTSPGATFQWSPVIWLDSVNKAQPLWTPTAAGTFQYILKVTYVVSGVSVSAFDTVLLTANPNPVITANPDSVNVCSGSPYHINFTSTQPGTTYTWTATDGTSGTGNVPNTSVVTVGLVDSLIYYTVIGRTASGCADTITVPVVIKAVPTITKSGFPREICGNTIYSGTITANSPLATISYGSNIGLSGSGGNVNLTINNPSTSVLIVIFTYTATLNGCASAPLYDTVFVNPLPQAHAGNDKSITPCASDSVLIGATHPGTFGTPGYTYLWSPAGGLSSPTDSTPYVKGITATTTYVVTVTDSKGCTASDDVKVTVTAPSISAIIIATGNTTWCSGSGDSAKLTAFVSGGVTPFTYVWSPLSFLTTTAAPQAVIVKPDTAGTYTYTVSVTDAKGCPATASQTITVNPTPHPVITGVNSEYCASVVSVPLTASVAGTWLPGPGIVGSTFRPSSVGPGVYTIVFRATAAGCTHDTFQVVTVDSLPIVTITGSSPTYCSFDSATTFVGLPVGGTWSGPGINTTTGVFTPSTVSIPNNVSTTVTVVYHYTNGHGCTDSASKSITINKSPSVNITANADTICQGSPDTLTPHFAVLPSSSIRWSDVNGTFITNSNNFIIVHPTRQDHGYVAQITSSAGCQSSDTIYIHVNQSPVANDDTGSTCLNSPVTVNVAANDTDIEGNVGVVRVLTVKHGTASVVANNVVYNPTYGYHGLDTVTYQICDVQCLRDCDTAKLYLSVCPQNLPPTADTVRYSALENAPHDVNVLLATSDPNGDPLTISIVDNPNPSITIVKTGNGAYTLTGTTAGDYVITYQVCDTDQYPIHVLCDTSVIVAHIMSPIDTLALQNHPPVASNDYATTTGTTPAVINVRGNDSDPDNDQLTIPFLVSGLPTPIYVTTYTSAHGVFVRNANGTVTFTPNAGLAPGIYYDSSAYRVCDTLLHFPAGGSYCAVAYIIVTTNVIDVPANRPPVAVDDHLYAVENATTTLNVKGNDSDPDGDALGTPSIVTTTVNGTITSVSTNGGVTYTPRPGLHGTNGQPIDSFVYSVCDTLAAHAVSPLCDTATVYIYVAPINLPPTADTVRYTEYVNHPHDVNVLLATSDPNGDPLNISLVGTSPLTIVKTGNGAYTVTSTTVGTYTITYQVCDTSPYLVHVLCDTSVIIATIIPTTDVNNHPPVANNDYATTTGTTPATVNVRGNDSDPDGDQLTTPTLVTTATTTDGSFVVNGDGTVTFTPNAGLIPGIYYDSVRYSVCDTLLHHPTGGSLCASAWVIVTTNVIDTPIANRPPLAVDDHLTVAANTTSTINVKSNDSDPDGDPLGTPTILVTTVNGAITGVDAAGNVTYTPTNGLHSINGQPVDSFQYQVCDTLSAHTPAPKCDIAEVYIYITPMNLPPTADTIRYTQLVNTPHDVNVLLAVSDPNSDPLTISLAAPYVGALTVANTGNGAYTVTSSATGTFVIVYQVCDTDQYLIHVLCDTSVIIATIVPDTTTPLPPVANNDYATTTGITPAVVNARGNDSDPQGNPLTTPVLLTSTTTAHGAWTVDGGGNVVFTPGTLTPGIYYDSVLYQICDVVHPGLCASAWVIVTTNVIDTPIANRPPLAVDDHITTSENTAVTANVKGNDSDPDGNQLGTPTVVSGPSNGTITAVSSNGNITYVPNNGLHSITGLPVDSFKYRVCDTLATHPVSPLCDIATVYVYVTPMNLPPTADTIRYTEYDSVPHDVNVLLATSDPNGDPLTISIVDNAGGLTIVQTGAGAYTITGTTPGVYVITYQVCDTDQYAVHVLCDTSVIIATIVPTGGPAVNHPPVANNDYATTTNTTPATVNVRGNDSDPDGNPLTIPTPTTPLVTPHGTFTIGASGNVVFQPNGGLAHGIYYDTLGYRVCDITTVAPQPLCATALVIITTNVIDTPVANRPPLATDDHLTVAQGATSVVNVKTNDSDPDGDQLGTPTVLSGPSSGTITAVSSNGNVTYTPNYGVHSVGGQPVDSFVYQVCDTLSAHGPRPLCDTATTYIYVTPMNLPPTADTIRYTTLVSTPHDVNVLLATSDPNSDPLTISLLNPLLGIFTINHTGNGAYTITVPTPGTFVIHYQVCDTDQYQIHVLCDSSVIIATIIPDTTTPLPPVANNDYATTTGTTPAVVNARGNDSDPQGNPLTTPVLLTSTTTAHGAWTVDGGGNVVFTPGTLTPGIYYDSVQYQICDVVHPGLCASAWVIVTTNVIDTPIANRPPLAVDDHLTVAENSSGNLLNVKANDSDPDGNPLGTPSILVSTVNGTITAVATNGNVTYTPNTGLHSNNSQPVDSFKYVVCDSMAAHAVSPLCDTAEVYIYVSPINLPPVANDITVNTTLNTSIGVNVASGAFDPNGDPLTYTYPTTTTVQGGTITITGNGSVIYTPPTGFIGVDQFVYQVCDNSPYNVHVLCDTGLVTINVTNPGDTLVNHPPVASNDYGRDVPGSTINVNVIANDGDPDGNPIHVTTINTTGTLGTVTIGTNNTINYTAPAVLHDSIYVDAFTYTICDSSLIAPTSLCTTATVYITINQFDTTIIRTNRPPVAVDDYTVFCEEDYSILNVLSNDIDPNGDVLTVTSIITGPAHGVAAVSSPNVVYIPATYFHGQDSLQYVACDNRFPALCDTAWVHYTVRIINHRPLANQDSVRVNMNASINVPVTVNDYEPDGDSTTLAIVTPPVHGAAVQVGNTYTYIPTPGYAGDDTFYYRVCDVQNMSAVYCSPYTQLCDVGMVSIHILHHPPVIPPTYVSIPQNSPPTTICPAVSDIDNNALHLTAFPCGPQHGTVGFATSDSCLVYTPTTDYVGQDTICVVVCDRVNPALCDTDKVYITVTPVCIPPVAVTDSYTVFHLVPNATLTVTANDTNHTTGTLALSIVNQPLNAGIVVVSGGSIRFTPNPAFTGRDSFLYAICSTSPACTACDTGLVILNISGTISTPPVAVNDSARTPQDSTVCVRVIANDIPGTNPIHVSSVCTPLHGPAVITAGGFICYTPAHGYFGPDDFCYTICDNSVPALCSTANVHITVSPNPHPPVAVTDYATVAQSSTVVICVPNNDHDPDGNLNIHSVSLVTLTNPGMGGSIGGINPATGCITYTAGTVVGVDSFIYSICDSTPVVLGGPFCSAATVYINVTPLNHPPHAPDTTVTTPQDSSIVVCPAITDVDAGQTVVIASACTPANGTVVVTGTGCVTYTPNSGFHGTDQFCYIACDDATPALCDTGIITVVVPYVPQCPVAFKDNVTGVDGVPMVINELTNDLFVGPIGAGYSVTIVSGPAAGNTAVVNANGTITYTAAVGYRGIDVIRYMITDSFDRCTTQANISIFIVDTCIGPILADDNANVCQEALLDANVMGNDYMGNSGFGTISIVQNGQHGFAFVNTTNNHINYTPATLYHGPDTVLYQVCDVCSAGIKCDTALLAINVLISNHAPVAVDDAATMLEDHADTINVLANDYDVDGDALTVSISAQPAHGTLLVRNNQLVYKPTANYCGTDTFGYMIVGGSGSPLCTGQRTWDLGLVFVNVICVNDTPVIPDTLVHVPEDSIITVCVPFTDPDVGDVHTATVYCNPLHGTLVSTATASDTPALVCMTYKPDTNFYGVDSICVVLCDNGTPALCDTSHIIIIVDPRNEPPVVQDQYVSTPKGQPVPVNVSTGTYDPNGDPITYSYGPTANGGTWTPNSPSNGTGVYTPTCIPPVGGVCVDSFQVYVCDNSPYFVHVLCDTAWIHVTIYDTTGAANHAPVANNDYAVTDTSHGIIVYVAANDLDPDGDALTVPTIITGPTHGTVGYNALNQVVYGPVGPFTSAITVDSFQYSICDTNAVHTPRPLCDTAWAYITINYIDTTVHHNLAPVAVDDYASTHYGNTVVVPVLHNDSDPNGDPIHITTTVLPGDSAGPHFGTVAITGTTITYTPFVGPGLGPNAHRPDTFYYVICDTSAYLPHSLCDTARVIITVPNSVQAVNDFTTTGHLVPVVVCVKNNDYDPELDAFSVIGAVQTPGSGTVALDTATGCFTYTPSNTVCTGDITDSFSYQIMDTLGARDTAWVYIHVKCCEVIANDDTFRIFQGDTLLAGILINDGLDPTVPHHIAFLDTTGTLHGALAVVGDSIRYTPDSAYCGLTIFRYVVSDTCGRDTANVAINITCANKHHPTIVNDTISLCKNTDTVIHVLLNDFDVDSDAISISSYTQGFQGGTVTQNDSVLIYHPVPGFTGLDTFTYRGCDNGVPVLCNTATVFINIQSCTTPPSDTTVHDTTTVCTPGIIIRVDSIYQSNGYNVFVSGFCDSADHGILTVDSVLTVGNYTTIQYTYTPNCDTTAGATQYTGNDTICVNVCATHNQDTACSQTHIIITILPKAPVDSIWANNDVTYACVISDTIPVMANDGFAPNPGSTQTGTAIHITAIGGAAGLDAAEGTMVISGNNIIYTPNDPTFVGVDSFRYAIADNGIPQQFDTATVIVYVCTGPTPIAVDDNTLCTDTTTLVNTPGTINVLANDTLYPAQDTTVTIVTNPSHGSAVVNADMTVTYTPDSGFHGNDNLVYELCETVGPVTNCDRASVCINVIDTVVPCFFPNGFSPNNDGVNDLFRFPCNENFPKATLRVYNRWGDAVWQSNGGYKNDWDGTNQSGTALPDGTYYFIYEYNDGSGKSEARFVVLHRGQ